MGEATGITWTDHTYNAWWGCQRVSPGCENCYAESWDKARGGPTGPHWGPTAARRFFGDKHWNEPLKWNRDALATFGRRARVFCSSMADVFEDRRDLDDQRARLWNLIRATPNLDWQLLTKRPENIDRLAPGEWVLNGWPENVWLGTTAEDQQRADQRIPILLAQRASVHFASYEPALGPVDFTPWVKFACFEEHYRKLAAKAGGEDRLPKHLQWNGVKPPALAWVIVGGESGGGARAFNLSWARSTVALCKAAGVSVFVKQLGARPMHAMFPEIDTAMTLTLRDRKGGAMEEWPADLRVREFPEARP